jgi:hypothetical protein
MTVGGVLSRSLDLYLRFFVRFVLTAALVYVVIDFARAAVATLDTGSTGAFLFWLVVSLALSLVGFFWLTGALVEAVHDVRDGRIDTTIGELFERTRPKLPALIAAGVLAALGILVGLVLLIVPGLFLLTRWSLVAPVVVLEGKGPGDALGRSWELVRGHSWRVFAVIVITGIATSVLSRIVQSVVAAILPEFSGLWLGGLVADSLVAPFTAVAWTTIYFELARPAGEAPAPSA